MKKLGVFVVLVGSLAVVAGTWDSATENVGACVSTGTSANATIPQGAYVVGVCDAAAYVGNTSPSLADGGPTCTNQDGGSLPICQLREASKPFYIRADTRDTKIACLSVSGTATCNLFKAKD